MKLGGKELGDSMDQIRNKVLKSEQERSGVDFGEEEREGFMMVRSLENSKMGSKSLETRFG